MNNSIFLLSLLAFAISSVYGLPNCEKETSEHCLGEGADFSPDGIKKCIAAVADKSKDCTQYLDLMANCADDLQGDGACASDNLNGDAMPCLLQRVDTSKLSAGCQAALPVKEEAKGLRGKFWKDGKRELSKAEQAELEGEDVQVYKRWWKRKQKKGGKARDKMYAILMQKRAKTRKMIIFKAASAVTNSIIIDGKTDKQAQQIAKKAVKEECKRYRKKDKDLKFDRDTQKDMVKEAIKDAKTQIRKRDL